MSQIEDYRLLSLYNEDILNDTTNLNTYLLGFMILAMPEFSSCLQDLTDRNDTTMVFNFTMTDENKKILSKLMVKEWMAKELKDILQMRWNITDSDFKHYSEAQNTKSKQDVLSELREECSQLLIDYGLKHNDWTAWTLGNFM
jgi:hypothetical protein